MQQHDEAKKQEGKPERCQNAADIAKMTAPLRRAFSPAPERGEQEAEAAQADAGARDQGQEGQKENQAGDSDSFYVGILG
ncbi:hypothetical protein [Pseudoduganella buxea]|uniref:Uncharacterized protein n=1 Tax=Pseudoduganella buxea TaxID=1949069 RepID=A0ABQ1KTU5_9BURK|nr:hypothetical protein [Pseudoduganella buxea]GGC07252.1 hypothetical protein GCM10011572_31030 [Pseudoduganella buxea]